jgi:hypothetical protein
MRRCAKLVSTRRVKDCDAGLYVYIPPKSQFETNTVIIELSTSRNRFSVKYSG